MCRVAEIVCVWAACLTAAALAVKVKVVMRSDEDSRLEEEDRVEPLGHRHHDATTLPFVRRPRKHSAPAAGPSHTSGALPAASTAPPADDKPLEFDDAAVTDKPRPSHPNELIFPLIYRQSHINSMFKFGESWYTWATEKRTDGSKAINYYICHEEPKRCDDIGWERTDALPNCAFQIDSLTAEDRVCVNPFGVEPRAAGACDGAEQMRVSDVVRACGPRIRSLWRFVRAGHRAAAAAKPADVNSLLCEDEEECYITVEYRIHHDRITFSLHEPSRGQTFKSALKRESPVDEELKPTVRPRAPRHPHHEEAAATHPAPRKKFHLRPRVKTVEGKGVIKERERNDSGYSRRLVDNKIKVREDISDDISE